MTDSVAEITPAIASRPANVRSRTTNNPQHVRGVDGRSAIMRRRRDLIGIYAAAVGDQITDSKMVEIVRAADLVAAGETQRSLSLRGHPVDVLALVRLENLAGRAVKALGIDQKRGPAGPTLATYLAARNAEQPEDGDESDLAEAANEEMAGSGHTEYLA